MDRVFDIFNQYATDPNKELQGVWIAIGPAQKFDEQGKPVAGSEPYIKVARNGNRRHGRIASQLWESNETTLKGKDDTADEKAEEVTVEAMAQGILLGWKNITFKGEKFPDAGTDEDKTDPELRLSLAKRMLRVKDFRDMVNKHAMDRERFLLVQEEKAAKN